MKSFSEFLFETRSPERALKLFDYLKARRKREGKWKTGLDKSYYDRPEDETSLNPIRQLEPHIKEPRWWKYEGEEGELVDIPVHKLRTLQGAVFDSMMPSKLSNTSEEDDEGDVLYLPKHDLYVVTNGNHRAAAARLRRDKTIRLRTFFPRGYKK